MSNGRITNAILNEKLEILLKQVSNIDGRLTSLRDEVALANDQHDQQMALLKKKSPSLRPKRMFYLYRLRA